MMKHLLKYECLTCMYLPIYLPNIYTYLNIYTKRHFNLYTYVVFKLEVVAVLDQHHRRIEVDHQQATGRCTMSPQQKLELAIATNSSCLISLQEPSASATTTSSTGGCSNLEDDQLLMLHSNSRNLLVDFDSLHHEDIDGATSSQLMSHKIVSVTHHVYARLYILSRQVRYIN